MLLPFDPPLCRLDEIPDGRARLFEFDGRAIAVYRVGDRVHVLGGTCPHAGGSMGHGWVEDGEAVCPLHRWRFRLDDGRCTTMRGEWLSTYRTEVRDGQVYVRR